MDNFYLIEDSEFDYDYPNKSSFDQEGNVIPFDLLPKSHKIHVKLFTSDCLYPIFNRPISVLQQPEYGINFGLKAILDTIKSSNINIGNNDEFFVRVNDVYLSYGKYSSLSNTTEVKYYYSQG